jgi:RNA polymerase sigma factor FliA
MTALPTAPTHATPTDALWTRYRSSGDPVARAELLDRYIGLVHHVAREIGARTPAVELDELVSAGTLGLVLALDSFDLGRGLAFSTYAVRRIRGAILDELRSRDWAPRSVRARGRMLRAAVERLQSGLGRAPRPQEVASALGVDLETYWQWRGAVEGNVLVSFEGVARPADGLLTLKETLDDPNAPIPGAALTEEEQVQRLQRIMAKLSERERTVLALYYYEGLNLRQIGEVLQVTATRVSQIRTKALRRMRNRLTVMADL